MQNVARQIAAVRARLDQLKAGLLLAGRLRPPFGLPKPFRELIRQQFTKHFSNAHTREKVAGASDSVLFFLVKSKFWTVQGQAHELAEADYPSVFDFSRNPFSQFVQKKMFGADLAISPATKRSIWQKSMHFSI